MRAALDAVVAFGLVAFLAYAAFTAGPKVAAVALPTPTPTPTPTPPPPTPTPTCIVDNVCRPPESHLNCPADCAPPQGRLVGDLRLARPDYRAGETVEAQVRLQNTGSVTILSEQVSIEATVLSLKDPVCNALLERRPAEERTRSRTLNLAVSIAPGETKELRVALETPAEYQGCPLAGEYRVRVTVSADGVEMGSVELQVSLG